LCIASRKRPALPNTVAVSAHTTSEATNAPSLRQRRNASEEAGENFGSAPNTSSKTLVHNYRTGHAERFTRHVDCGNDRPSGRQRPHGERTPHRGDRKRDPPLTRRRYRQRGAAPRRLNPVASAQPSLRFSPRAMTGTLRGDSSFGTGAVSSSTPFSYQALIWSASTRAGSLTDRSNTP
jgi:hypothetical protein